MNRRNLTNAYKIKKWIINERYFEEYSAEWDNDIGLIQLDRPINFEKHIGYMKINGICLPDPNYNRSNEEEYALFSGWGIDNSNRKAKFLQMGWIRILKPFNNSTDLFSRIHIFTIFPFPNGSKNCRVSKRSINFEFNINSCLKNIFCWKI